MAGATAHALATRCSPSSRSLGINLTTAYNVSSSDARLLHAAHSPTGSGPPGARPAPAAPRPRLASTSHPLLARHDATMTHIQALTDSCDEQPINSLSEHLAASTHTARTQPARQLSTAHKRCHFARTHCTRAHVNDEHHQIGQNQTQQSEPCFPMVRTSGTRHHPHHPHLQYCTQHTRGQHARTLKRLGAVPVSPTPRAT